MTTLLPPAAAANSGYFFVPEAMIRRLVGPAAKISEKRRLQCYNNLVMLNNASLFYRMEYGRSPKSLAELVEGRFVDPAKIVCPHGGAYAYDPGRDACTCSLHNRLKYLTPNIELTVLSVSQNEAAEYDRYKQRYQAFWQGMFDPDRRADHGGPPREAGDLRAADGQRQPVQRAAGDGGQDAAAAGHGPHRPLGAGLAGDGARPQGDRPSSSAKCRAWPKCLQANPTLTDLAWLGDRVSLHFCDGDSILQVDPAMLRPLQLPLLGNVSIGRSKALAAALLMAVKMPVYVTIDVENRDQAAKLLEQLSQQVILQGTDLGGFRLSADAYRLPDYKGHPLYVFGVELYAVKLRLHVAVVGDQFVVATKPELLREVIDASTAEEGQPPAARPPARAPQSPRAEAGLRRRAALLGREGPHGLQPQHQLDLQPREALRGQDRRRAAAFRGEVRRAVFLSRRRRLPFRRRAEPGVCSVHGNREQSRQNPHPDRKASFARFIENLDELTVSLRFQDDALLTTVEIVRSAKGKP